MRAALAWLVPIVGGALLLRAPLPPLAAQSGDRAALSGRVTSDAEGPMEGVLVSARKAASSITVTVVSDREGRYRFPESRLEPGEYALRIRAAGYDLDRPAAAKVAAQTTATVDLKLVKTRDLAAQLTNADWFASVPGTEAQKASIRGCTHCHTLERIARTRYDVEKMTAVIERMSTYPQLSFPLKIQKLPAPRIGGGQQSPDQIRAGWRRQAEYLTTINLSSGTEWSYALKTPPRPKRRATQVIYTEYDLPQRTRQPHDVIVDSGGLAWYASFGEQILGALDPKTGTVTEYPIPTLKPEAPTGILGVRFDRDENVWMGMQFQGGIAKFDRRSRTFQTWSLPANLNGPHVQINQVSPDRASVDGKVWLQDAGTYTVLRLDVASGTFDVFEPYKIPRPNVYDVIPDSRNNGYFLVLGAEDVGRIDAKTGAIRIFKTPTPRSGPRRGMMDAQDRLWFGENNGDRIGMFDTRTETFREWPVPTPGAWPYDVTADRNGEVWSGGEYDDRILRLDPKSGEFVAYLLPRSTNVRRVFVDNRTTPVTFWVGNNHGASIVKLEPLDSQTPAPTPAPAIFEGARLIAGDGRTPIENAAFVVENGRVTQVGPRDAVKAPAGARHVNLAGKTVMPAIVDAHVHLGYRRGTTFTADNYTRENVVDELDRFSYYGVAAVLEAGTGRSMLPFQIRDGPHSGARYLTAGRGFAMPQAGPGVPMRDAPYGVTTEAEARRDVQELAASRPDMIKIWVDDRNGTVEKLKPDLCRAIIDEAHKHGIRVMAHISALDDAKDLLRAGVDGFGHVVRDKDVDDELIAMLRERPAVFFLETLWGERNAIYGGKPAWLGEPLLRGTLADEEVASLTDGFSTGVTDSARRLLRNVAALNRAGVRLGLGTDTGGVTGGGYFGLASLVELELMVKAGLTPSQAIVAATRTSADILKLDALGTIAPGKSASFIVLDGNPLEDIASTRKIAAVYLDGAEVDRAALRGRWSSPPPSLASVMERAGRYAAAFQRRLSNLVAEERYVQDIARINLAPGRFVTEPHRELRSDLLLVRPDGGDRYVEFRDVFEVDGKAVRDRQDRLTALFLEATPSAEAQIQRISRESARYNIGNIERTINTPTLPLLFLLPQNQSRFRFTRGTKPAPAIARAVPADAWVVEYEESQRPTLIRTNRGLDLPARGRFWVDAATGRVVMTELVAEDPSVRATIDVAYQWDPLVGLMVPAEMRERYEGRRDGAVIEGNATYGKIRQFQVQANERLGRADPVPVEPPPASKTPAVPPGTPIAAPEPHDAPAAPPPAPAPVATPPAQDAPKPQLFAARTELVLVDFVVSDKADQSVRGLTAKDFVVKEDGKERPIVSFEAFAADTAATAPAPASVAAPTPPAAATAPHAATVLLIDDGQLSPPQAARLRPAIKALLARAGEPSRRLMLVAPGSNISVLAQLPAGAADMAPAVDRIEGTRVEEHSNFPIADAEALAVARGDLPALARVAARFAALNPELTAEQANAIARERANMIAHDARARRNAMYDAVLLCLDWLADRPGRHSLIVVSAGFASDPDDSKYYDVVTRSLRANAPIHFLDARGLPGISGYKSVEYSTGLSRETDEGPFGWAQAAEGSTDLADATGGVAVRSSNDMEKGFGRLLDSMTTYYVLAYQPSAHDNAGFRRIKVEVRRKGLHVRARSGYYSAASGGTR